jgi:hypothetical protein
MPKDGLRFLSKIYKNLPPEFRDRPVTPTARVIPITSALPKTPIVEEYDSVQRLEERLQKIELLLERLLIQKREKIVFRDKDDLIERVIDQPLLGDSS